MKKILMTLMLLTVLVITAYAQDKPGTNLGKSLYTMKQEFPELRFIGSDENGERYQDGYTEDGISMFFRIRNNSVVEECMICDSDDGFSKMWFDELWKSFSSKWPYSVKVNKPYSKMFDFGSFKILMTFSQENGTNRALILYSR